MFSPSADYIDAPAGHSHINAHKKRAIVTINAAKTMQRSPQKEWLGSSPHLAG
jgi:hypothetical protein